MVLLILIMLNENNKRCKLILCFVINFLFVFICIYVWLFFKIFIFFVMFDKIYYISNERILLWISCVYKMKFVYKGLVEIINFIDI